MFKTLHLLFLSLAVLTASLLPASPVRSNMGGDELSRLDPDDGPQNLWVWPTMSQSIRHYESPNSIWTPEIGMWYCMLAANGYKDMNGSNFISGWGENYVITRNTTGYSAGTFLVLDPGHYILTCKVDGQAAFRSGFYTEVEGGYKWMSYSNWTPQSTAGIYERVFTVPNGAALTMILFSAGGGADIPPLTVTEIEIYRID